MTEALLSYRSLESRLRDTRWRHSGDESRKEDAILDEMEQAWLKLSDEERRLLRAEGPTCWPTGPSRQLPRCLWVSHWAMPCVDERPGPEIGDVRSGS